MENKELAVQQESNAVLSMIERVALDPNVDISKLERMLDMQERILNRNAQQAFTAAFADMQIELPEITRDAKIQHSGKVIAKYARFEDINEAVKPILAKHGFGISFSVTQDGQLIKVKGKLSHREGHSESTEMALPADSSGSKNAVQAIASSVSYAKRHVLCAILNISTRGEDDDGQASNAKVTPFQRQQLERALNACDDKVQARFAEKFGDVAEVPKGQFPAVFAHLNKERIDADN